MTEYIRVIRPDDALRRYREQIAAEFQRARGDAPAELDEREDT